MEMGNGTSSITDYTVEIEGTMKEILL
jgi:hypothetical protein